MKICFTKSQLTDFYYQGKNAPSFRSSHWDEPNVISHLRLNERTYKGKKVTFMEELQSDWAREGRSKGFTEQLVKKVELKDVEVIKSGEGIYQVKIDGEVVGDTYPRRAELANKTNAEQLLKEEYANKHNAGKLLKEGGVPNNPLLKNWQELSVKRALKEAVDNNSEYLAWTTGEQQAARYNLAKDVKNIKWITNDGEKVINIQPKEGTYILVNADKNGIIQKGGNNVPSTWFGKKISEAIPKGIGDKILAETEGNLSGEGLNIGGEWAKNLYDKQVKNIVEDITGGKVEIIKISQGKAKYALYNKSTGDSIGGGYTLEEVRASVIKNPNREYKLVEGGETEQQAIRLTPEIKALVKGEALKLKRPSGINPLE